MSDKQNKPIVITPGFYQLGTPAYPAYLSVGEDAILIEGGIGATSALIVKQLQELSVTPEKMKYIALTHTHPDHIGGVIFWKKLWPQVKVIANTTCSMLLKSENLPKEFTRLDAIISENLLIKGEISDWPAVIENPVFDVDMVLKEGDKIDLGRGISWTVYDTPGHSPCHTSYYNHSQGILIIGDATGLYDPSRDIFWPNYFDSLELYCDSIRKLYTLHGDYGALSHNGVVKGDIKNHLRKAMKATESFHNGMLTRVANGEDPKKVTLETARHVYTFTNMQPFEVIYGLTKLMFKRSQVAAGKPDLFKLP